MNPPLAEFTIFPFSHPPKAGQGHLFASGRTTILLLGSDTDGKGNDPNNGVPLAQTVMIVTIDGQTNAVGMLSIPRDMQVTEDGSPEPKLDEVFSHKSQSRLRHRMAVPGTPLLRIPQAIL